MKIRIKRLDATDRGIFGRLTLDSGPFTCVTLENHSVAIAEGTWKVTLDKSPHLGYVTPHIHVPARDTKAGGDAGLRIHILNFENQSEGCIGVGMERDGTAISHSKAAFDLLMAQLKGADDIWLELT